MTTDVPVIFKDGIRQEQFTQVKIYSVTNVSSALSIVNFPDYRNCNAWL